MVFNNGMIILIYNFLQGGKNRSFTGM